MKIPFKLPPPPVDEGIGSEYSPFSTLLLAIQDRIKSQVPEIRFVDEDKGQLEVSDKPPVSWPCLLVSFDEFEFTDNGDGLQEADGLILLRLGLEPFSKTSSIQPKAVKVKGLSIYDLEEKIFKALHNWKPHRYGALLRRRAIKENRPDDGIRVRRLYYQNTFMDYGAVPNHGSVALPEDMEIEED